MNQGRRSEIPAIPEFVGDKMELFMLTKIIFGHTLLMVFYVVDIVYKTLQ
jgi:hypothetical protein